MPHELIPIRLSHLLGHSGVAGIVRGANGLVVVQDTRHWTDRAGMHAGNLIPYVERVRAALGIKEQLREPPVAKELANGQVDGACVPGEAIHLLDALPGPWRNVSSAVAE